MKFTPLNIIATMRTPEERSAGLNALQKPLRPTDAMLFIFPYDTDSTFWNRGVKYPIDVAFFDKKKRLVDIKQMQADQTQPVKPLNSHYRYVLETNLNWFSKNKVPAGTLFTDLIITKQEA